MTFFRPSSVLPRLKPLSGKRTSVVTVLDIGSSKVVCMIGRLTPLDGAEILSGRSHKIEILGIGHQKSRGLKAGVISDMEAVENSVRLAVDAAERMANMTVESLIVNVSAGRLTSETHSAIVNLGGHEITSSDLRKVVSAATRQTDLHERAVLHSLPAGYILDGERGISDPLGMYGDVLGVEMHVLTAERAPLKNLELSINRAHLTVDAMVATPYASGLAALVSDEAEMGCAAIDMGGGTTTISVFADGKMVHADAIAIGGQHVTMDLARGLSTRFEDAERIKVVHGSAAPQAAEDRDIVSVPPIGDDDHDMPVQVPRGLVARIVRARVEETLEMIRERIQQSGYASVVGKRIVLTGGASQLTGLTDTARRILARNVRVGRPLGVSGLPAAAKGPAFSTAVGLMIYPQVAGLESHAGVEGGLSMIDGKGRLATVGRWLKESF
ncbi:cell division protein FtsA [Pseudohoeflea suaedae]|uniref:Cell division protein FtsA n=1 Tax=Pseudohoeflea suaedae TaxID=877384 RepID=A0A4R5PIB7_9HYPH|nr:cell division protein FtsA [Pseudohoeflea suaedae]TDH34251.1 cell division protein FtsA [Pseudohoeflea suaedae]